MNNWRDIWCRRSLPGQGDVLQRLIFADGFDCGAGRISVDAWMEYVGYIAKRLGLLKEDSIFEVGCGSGAFIFPFFQSGHRVGGIDYSPSLIEIASTVMEGMEFGVCEAHKMDVVASYDVVISNGVFHYFSDLDYAELVLGKMLKKATRSVAVLEIPDLQRAAESEMARRGALSSGEYDKKYSGLRHLYYSRQWFAEQGMKLGWDVTIFDQHIRNYGNSSYRFNCVLENKI